jgi:hypothetical protein
LGVGRKGGIGVGDDPSASSFTRCLLNKADGRQAGPPSLVIGARAAAKPECFYLRAPGSTSIPSIRILAEPRKPNFCAGGIPMHYYPAAQCNPIQSCHLIRRGSRLPNPAVRGGMAALVGETGSKVRFARHSGGISTPSGRLQIQFM